MTDLLEAVEALTKPRTSRVIQSNEAGITCTTTVEVPPLLDQLEASIRSSMGGSTSGSSLAFEGAPLNTGALFEAMKITAQIDSWCHMVGVIALHKPGHDLRTWYAVTLLKPFDTETEAFYIKQMGGWARAITNLLDPPREKELPDDCPNCGAGEWWRDGAKYMRPLVVRYRPDEPVGNATAMCRACADVWNARELAYAIEEAAKAG